ncbi:MAG: PQQ-dependent sugar dehydrogenase [Pseudomonadota bacterium]
MQKYTVWTLFLFLLGACGGENETPPPGLPVPANTAPELSVPGMVEIEENATGTVATIDVSDADGDPVTLSLGGADAGVFVVDAAGPALALAEPLDFEQPADADGDNVYEVTITAADPSGATASAEIIVTVTNVAEALAASTLATAQLSDAFDRPVQTVTSPVAGDERILVVEQGGLVRLLDPASGAIDSVPFLDVSAEVSNGNEQGLLGLAFSPSFAADQRVFVNLTNTAGDTEIRSYQTFTATADQVDPATEDVILEIGQPFSNHNAGWIGFANDGLLLIPTGDGGSAGDPNGFAQNPASLLGKILRIDVTGDDFPGDPLRDYAIPPDNPFTSGGGAPEIFALGLRNPFRASIDGLTGDLYIGDVGQDLIEEVSRIEAGAIGSNFGWNLREGSQAFNGGASSPNFTEPLIDYDHGSGIFEGFSIIGGVVYRGSIVALADHYIFADTVTANVWAVALANLVDGTTVSGANGEFIVLTDLLNIDAGTLDTPTNIGLDANGELLLTDLDGDVFRIAPGP